MMRLSDHGVELELQLTTGYSYSIILIFNFIQLHY